MIRRAVSICSSCMRLRLAAAVSPGIQTDQNCAPTALCVVGEYLCQSHSHVRVEMLLHHRRFPRESTTADRCAHRSAVSTAAALSRVPVRHRKFELDRRQHRELKTITHRQVESFEDMEHSSSFESHLFHIRRFGMHRQFPSNVRFRLRFQPVDATPNLSL